MLKGLAPAVTFFNPAVIIDQARTTAVVVPSPATSLVFSAACFKTSAPKFSVLSSNSISLAIVTPSLVIIGEPNPLSKITLEPFGPKVILTVWANLSTPLLRA